MDHRRVFNEVFAEFGFGADGDAGEKNAIRPAPTELPQVPLPEESTQTDQMNDLVSAPAVKEGGE